jgi:hypothetical protein
LVPAAAPVSTGAAAGLPFWNFEARAVLEKRFFRLDRSFLIFASI